MVARIRAGRVLEIALPVLAAATTVSCTTIVPTTAPSSIERIWINRTMTQIEVQEGFIPACSKVPFTQRDIEAAEALRESGQFPPSPPGTIDYTRSQYFFGPQVPRPVIIVVLPNGKETISSGTVDESALPPCAGQAVQPSAPD